MALLYGGVGALNIPKMRFPARAVPELLGKMIIVNAPRSGPARGG